MPKNYAAELCIRVGRRFIWFGAILFGLVLCVVFSAHLDLRSADCGVRPQGLWMMADYCGHLKTLQLEAVGTMALLGFPKED